MKKSIILSAVILFFMAVNINAQSCGNGNRAARKIFETGSYADKWQAGSVYNPFQLYKSVVAHTFKNSGTVGPRQLYIQKRRNGRPGTIVGGTTRTFVTNPAETNNIMVVLEKSGGKAKTGVVICSYAEDGTTTNLKNFTFNNGNYSQTKKFSLTGVKNKIIVIAMKNKSTANTFKYKVQAY